MSFIIYVNPYNTTRICIMYPTGEVSIPELISRHITTPYKICSVGDIAHLDKEFIDSWQLLFNEENNATLVINMTNAKMQWRDKLRSERMPLLEQLDIQYMRALEQNDTQWIVEIVNKKQKLRDAPGDPRIDAAASPEELKQLTLDILTL